MIRPGVEQCGLVHPRRLVWCLEIDVGPQQTDQQLQPIGFFQIAQAVPTEVGSVLLKFEFPTNPELRRVGLLLGE